ncbi:MAG: hypothetical protein ACFFDP_04505 [Promethearchaeota archaeon]
MNWIPASQRGAIKYRVLARRLMASKKPNEVKCVGEEDKMAEELRREIEGKHKLKQAPKSDRDDVDLSAEKALLEKLRREGKLEEEE